jgi:phenylacetate-CoA ligase
MDFTELLLTQIGSPEVARTVYDRMLKGSKAYSGLISETLGTLGKSNASALAWDELPLVTKKGFFANHAWRDFIPKDAYTDVYSVIRSSGTSDGNSNRGFFWPQLKSVDAAMAPSVHSSIVKTFSLDSRKTLVIIGLSLGSWAGGEQYSFIFKSLALNSQLPLVVFSPGNQHQEIMEIIEKCHTEFDQIIIGVCPSAIFYLERMAQQGGTAFPLDKISFLVTGEPFPEALRVDLQTRSGQAADRLPVLSVYGSADTGILGVESLPLVRVRQYLSTHPEVAQKLGFTSQVIPNLYHAQLEDVFLEVVNEELVITKWQGIPLVRYNLEDRVQIFRWKTLCATIAAADPNHAAMWKQFAVLDLTDVLSVTGRSQGCVFLCGSNVFESMLQQVLLHTEHREKFTGSFVVWSEVERGQQQLHWQIELKPGHPAPEGETLKTLHAEFVTLLSKQQPEFGEDYEKFYRPAEKDGLNIFRFYFNESPSLSEKFQAATKRKIIVEKGPL